MQFTLTVTYPNGQSGQEWHGLTDMRSELASLSAVLEALVPGESITVRRIS